MCTEKQTGIFWNLIKDNAEFVKSTSAAFFGASLAHQDPRATIVTCCDSRLHMHAFDFTPENDLFVVRCIGNQIQTALGSVEYGIKHLKTPVLMIIGHTGCGAVTAATKAGEIFKMELPIRRELISMELRIRKECPTEAEIQRNIEENIHAQVEFALAHFKETPFAELLILGALYDLHNVYREGHGKLIVVNAHGIKMR
jgi:carbonic anhydrase